MNAQPNLYHETALDETGELVSLFTYQSKYYLYTFANKIFNSIQYVINKTLFSFPAF